LALTAGQKLGPYEIIAPSGAGGMGEVYKAKDTRLERTVAIKILPAISQENASIRQRFEREAKSISSLNHPNICTLFDVGHQDGIDYLVMEYLDGETLSSRLSKGSIPQPELFTLGIQIADALDNAHRQGLIHRDLKPGNIMLTKTGAKLMDFGLAKLHHGGGVVSGGSYSTHTTPLTGEGAIIGTLQYMSPEQLEGKEADQRSDIFAFGAVLYEMATGQKAFKGSSQASLIASIMMQEPISGTNLQSLSPPLERLIRKCLAKNPDDRWQTARDLKDELQWISGGGGGVTVASESKSKIKLIPILTVIAAVAAISTIVFGTLLFNRAPAPKQTMRFSIPSDSTITSIHSVRISPDGSKLAFLAQGGPQNNRFIYVRPLNSMVIYQLPSTENAIPFCWSPDSKYLAYFDNGLEQLKKVSVTGGPSQLICETDRGAHTTWGKDGSILFDFTVDSVLHQVSVSGGVVTDATRLDTTAGETHHSSPFFLPDGRHFLYLATIKGVTNKESHNSMVKVGSLDGQETKSLFHSDSRIEYDPAGFILYSKDSALMARRFDADALKLIGDPFPVEEQLDGRALGQFSVSNTGMLTYTGQSRSNRWSQRQLCWLDRKGKVISIVGDSAAYRGVRLSHDGKKIAYVVEDEESWNGDIWIRDLERNVPSRLTFDSAYERCPLWSADDSKILFARSQKGAIDFVIKSSDGLGKEEVIATIKKRDDLNFYPQSWSFDGTFMTCLGFNWSSWEKSGIYLFNPLSDSVPRPLRASPSGEFGPALSPDERFLAYSSEETGERLIYVIALDSSGGKWQISNLNGGSPMWGKDGKELFFIGEGDSLVGVWSVPITHVPSFKFGIPAKLFEADIYTTNDRTYQLWRYDVTADGQRFIVDRAIPRPEENQRSIQVVLNWSAEFEGK